MSLETSESLAKASEALTKKHPDAPAPSPAVYAGCDTTTATLIGSLLIEDASEELASGAIDRFQDELVDYNELRICTADEIVSMLGSRYPDALRRAHRIRESLNAVFSIEHSLSLARLESAPKRDARAYLESLPGLSAFAAARTSLLGLGVHAFPADTRIVGRLRELGVDLGVVNSSDACGVLERGVRAGDAAPLYLRLELDLIASPYKAPKAAGSSKRTTKKKTSKKSSKKASSGSKASSKKVSKKRSTRKKASGGS